MILLRMPGTAAAFPDKRASKATLATTAGSAFRERPTHVSCIPARSYTPVSVTPGITQVTETPLSFNSYRSACVNEYKNAFEAQ